MCSQCVIYIRNTKTFLEGQVIKINKRYLVLFSLFFFFFLFFFDRKIRSLRLSIAINVCTYSKIFINH